MSSAVMDSSGSLAFFAGSSGKVSPGLAFALGEPFISVAATSRIAVKVLFFAVQDRQFHPVPFSVVLHQVYFQQKHSPQVPAVR